MKVSVFRAATAVTATCAVTGFAATAFADPPATTTTTTTTDAQAAPAPAAQPAPVVVQQPQAQPAPAPAPQTVVVAPSGSGGPARDSVSKTEHTPNTGMITTGALLFGIPYTASVIVAASSPQQADRNLYVPVIGPWIDLANRNSCVGAACQNETTNKVMLVANGILQTVGVLDFVGGFVFPATKTTTKTAKVESKKVAVHVTPTAGYSNVGLAAFGTF